MSGRTVVVWVMALLVILPVSVRGRVVAEIKDLGVNEIRVAAFTLDREGDIAIEAVAFGPRGSLERLGLDNVWILAADTRDVVWSLENGESEKRSKHLREYTDGIRLPKGRYEVYYSTQWYSGAWGKGVGIEDAGDAISAVLREVFGKAFDYKEYRKAVRDFRVVVEGDGQSLTEKEVLDYHRRLKESAVVSLTGIGDDRCETLGLTLERPMVLQVYAVGEVTKQGSYDNSWIVDTATHQKVWKLDYANSVDAGGAEKNRAFKDAVSLCARSYALFCVTDDSHSYRNWNVAHPYDGERWGMTILVARGPRENVTPYDEGKDATVLARIAMVGDDEHRSGRFELTKDSAIRVYAIGEGERE